MSKVNIPKISDCEYEIMKVIWKHKKVTIKQLLEILSNKHDWSYSTIRTIANRLVEKKVLDYESNGKNYIYYPLIKKEEYTKDKIENLLNKVYNGSVETMFSSMFSYFTEKEKISKDEIVKLKEILDEVNSD